MSRVKLYVGSVVGVVSSLGITLFAHAQTWTQASTTLLVATSESNTASAYSINLPVVIPITIGLAVFFFLFGWLMSIATGRRK